MPGATSSVLAPSSDALVTSSHLWKQVVAWPRATSERENRPEVSQESLQLLAIFWEVGQVPQERSFVPALLGGNPLLDDQVELRHWTS